MALKGMRPVHVVAGGVSKFAKARPDRTFQPIVKEAFDEALQDLGLEFGRANELIDGTVGCYFSDHFMRQLKAATMVQDYLGLCPKPSHRVEGGGATGGLGFQEGWKSVASGLMDVCLVFGWETMSHVQTWKGNEFIALASDVSFDYPVGGFYSGYYAMMVVRHMHEFGTTVEQMAHVSVKNHTNALRNPDAHFQRAITVDEVLDSRMVADPLRLLHCCPISDGAAAVVLTADRAAVRVAGIGQGTDTLAVRHRDTLTSFRASRAAASAAFAMAGFGPERVALAELHDAFAPFELMSLEDLGLVPAGKAGRATLDGETMLDGRLPVNSSGGLKARGHPLAATGLAQIVECVWQLTGRAEGRQVEARVALAQSIGGLATNNWVTLLETP